MIGRRDALKILPAALSYFAIVFGAGFALGLIRVLWAEARFGTRMAELMEMPLMFVVIVLAARRIVRRFPVASTARDRLQMGGIALGLLLLAEFMLVTVLQGQSPGEYLAARDPVSGTAYGLMLIVFALMPLLAARK
jgi:hypothetical protein